MATELGVAYLSIVASTKDLAPSVRKSLGDVEQDANRTGGRIGSSLSGSMRGALSTISGGVAALTATVGGLALGGGISRALSIENAQAKLKGLGHDASSVTEIMNNALASVKGTAFGLGDAATVAAGIVAAGVKQGPQLEGILKTVADTATISGRSLTDIGTIFGSVAARGKLQGDDMLQLMSSGVPVLQFLSAQLGVSSADISDMVSKGQIDFATFSAAMQAGLGGAALASGGTFTGALANVRAALSRLGAQVATPAMASLKGVFNDAIPAIDQMTAGLTPLIAALAGRLAPVVADVSGKIFDWLANVDFSTLASGFSGLSAVLLPLLGVFGAIGGSSLAGMLGPLGVLLPKISGPMGLVLGIVSALLAQSPELRTALGGAFSAISGALESLAPLLPVLAGAVTSLTQALGGALASVLTNAILPIIQLIATQILPALMPILMSLITSVLPVVVGLLSGLSGWMSQNADLTGAFAVALLAGAAALKGLTVIRGLISAFQAWGGVQKIGTAIQAAWNAVMTANPIGIIIVAIAALVAGLVYFFTQTKLGREVWASFVEFLGTAWEWLKNAAAVTWAAIQSAAAPVVAWFQTYVAPLFSAIGDLFAAIFGRIGQVVSFFWTNVWQPIINLVLTYWQFLWGMIQAAWDTIGPPLIAGISGAWSVLSEVLSGVWNTLAAVFSGVWNALVIVVETVLGVITGIIRAVTSAINGDWSGAWNAIKGVFTTIWTGITDSAKNAVSTLGAVIGSVKDTILGVFSAAGDWLKDVGGKIIQGLIDGLKSGFEAVKNLLGDLTDLLPDWKGPASVDAKLLTGNGRLIMRSLVSGFKDEAPAVQKYLAGFTADIGSASSANLNMTGSAGNQSVGASNGAKRVTQTVTVNAAPDPIGTAMAVVRRLNAMGAA